MIKKLIKHDTKKMFWVLGYIYIISIALAGITRLFGIWSEIQFLNIIGKVFQGITYSAICNILVNTFISILKVFCSGFYGKESYLTHTLPITKDKLLLSKYISGLIVIISSLIVSFVTLFIMHYSKSFINLLKALIQTISGNFNVTLFIFLVILIIFAEICAFISMSFTAIVKANTYNSKRVLKGLLWFVVYYFGSMIAVLIVSVIIFALTGNISNLFSSTLSKSSFLTLILTCLVLYISFIFIFYFICKKLFKKGVNVD